MAWKQNNIQACKERINIKQKQKVMKNKAKKVTKYLKEMGLFYNITKERQGSDVFIRFYTCEADMIKNQYNYKSIIKVEDNEIYSIIIDDMFIDFKFKVIKKIIRKYK